VVEATTIAERSANSTLDETRHFSLPAESSRHSMQYCNTAMHAMHTENACMRIECKHWPVRSLESNQTGNLGLQKAHNLFDPSVWLSLNYFNKTSEQKTEETSQETCSPNRLQEAVRKARAIPSKKQASIMQVAFWTG